jgi:hypothetical protein
VRQSKRALVVLVSLLSGGCGEGTHGDVRVTWRLAYPDPPQALSCREANARSVLFSLENLATYRPQEGARMELPCDAGEGTLTGVPVGTYRAFFRVLSNQADPGSTFGYEVLSFGTTPMTVTVVARATRELPLDLLMNHFRLRWTIRDASGPRSCEQAGARRIRLTARSSRGPRTYFIPCVGERGATTPVLASVYKGIAVDLLGDNDVVLATDSAIAPSSEVFTLEAGRVADLGAANFVLR